MSVCDAFDTMITSRPYADIKTKEEALAELERCSASQFDPKVVQVMHFAANAVPQEAGKRPPLSPGRP